MTREPDKQMFELEGHNVAAASCGDIGEGMAPFSGNMPTCVTYHSVSSE